MSQSVKKLQSLAKADVLSVIIAADNNVSEQFPEGDLEGQRFYHLIYTSFFVMTPNLKNGLSWLIDMVGPANWAPVRLFSRALEDLGTWGPQGEEFWATQVGASLEGIESPAAERKIEGMILPPGLALSFGVGNEAGATADLSVNLTAVRATDPNELWPFINAAEGGISGPRG